MPRETNLEGLVTTAQNRAFLQVEGKMRRENKAVAQALRLKLLYRRRAP